MPPQGLRGQAAACRPLRSSPQSETPLPPFSALRCSCSCALHRRTGTGRRHHAGAGRPHARGARQPLSHMAHGRGLLLPGHLPAGSLGLLVAVCSSRRPAGPTGAGWCGYGGAVGRPVAERQHLAVAGRQRVGWCGRRGAAGGGAGGGAAVRRRPAEWGRRWRCRAGGEELQRDEAAVRVLRWAAGLGVGFGVVVGWLGGWGLHVGALMRGVAGRRAGGRALRPNVTECCVARALRLGCRRCHGLRWTSQLSGWAATASARPSPTASVTAPLSS